MQYIYSGPLKNFNNFKAIKELIIQNTFQRDNLFEVPEVKKDDISDYSSEESDSKGSSSSEEEKGENSQKSQTTSSSEESEDDNMKPGYLSDENETNAKNIRRNTY